MDISTKSYIICCFGIYRSTLTGLSQPEKSRSEHSVLTQRYVFSSKVYVATTSYWTNIGFASLSAYQQGYTAPAASSEYQSIPLDKIEDFGVHAGSYYPLKVSVFKSSLDTKLLDLLWGKYWVNTLSQSQIVTVRSVLRQSAAV